MSFEVGLEFVLNQLAEILRENYSLVKNLDKNIEKLNTELKLLRSLVADIQKQDHGSKYLNTLVKEIEMIIWQSKDVVECLALELTTYRSSNSLLSIFKARWSKAGEVKSITLTIQNIKRDLTNALNIAEHVPHAEPKLHEAPVVEVNNVVGFEKAIEDVEKIIHEGGNRLEIASIVGMLGLGKTTLANKVFMNPVNVDKFIIRAFVYVSRDYNRRDVFIQILRAFTQVSDELKYMRLQDLQSKVQHELERTPYLIVLDDVWETQAWDDLRDAFPLNNNVRSRVLITTRNEDVARHANGNGEPYKLDFLTPGKSIELLRRRVFGDTKPPRKELLESEATIATKCGGLPLTIVVTAGILLHHKDDVAFWKELATHGKSIQEDDEKITQMTIVIELMYKELPDHLKPCFLYLGVFVEDTEIPVWKLVRMWISEGMILPLGGTAKLQDRAEAYLQQLISRNLVIVAKKRADEEKIKTVRIHDTLRDFCKTKAREESVFHEVIDGEVYKLSGPASECCRLSIVNTGSGTEKFLSNVVNYVHLRSFLCFGTDPDKIPVQANIISRLPSSFKVLRVLEIEPLVFTRFPAKLSKLAFLKYLCMSIESGQIPASFSCLLHLQTLIVCTTSSTLEIKADIWKMPHFMHLHTNKPTILPSPKSDDIGGNDIQTLTTISPQSCTGGVFTRARNIRKLGIRGNLGQLPAGVLDRLCHLESLENLKLQNDVNSQLSGLTSHDNFPVKVTKITLINTRLAWGEMSKLGKLKALVVLKLKDHAFEGPLWNTEDGDFPSLKHLHIGHANLFSWKVASSDHFPQLETLIINNCTQLEVLPPQVGAITCLRSVSLHYTNAQLVASARKVFQKELSIRGQDLS